MEEKKQKKLKVYFCPKCRSFDVGYKFGFWNAFGILPKMQCKKCKTEGGIFPQIVVNKNKLNQMNKKFLNKNKGRKNKEEKKWE